MGTVGIYLEKARAWRANGYAPVPPWRLARLFGRWRANFVPGRSAMADESPWMTFAAIDFLARNVRPGDRVFEWGMGGSSFFFARRAARVVSVEHHAEWRRMVQEKMAAAGIGNWEGFLVEPSADGTPGADPGDPDAYLSSDPGFSGRNFRDYAAFIDRYPAGHFDVVVVDGRARPSCVKHAAAKAGRLVVVDNAERKLYGPSYAALRDGGWKRRSLAGPASYHEEFSCTDVWTR